MFSPNDLFDGRSRNDPRLFLIIYCIVYRGCLRGLGDHSTIALFMLG